MQKAAGLYFSEHRQTLSSFEKMHLDKDFILWYKNVAIQCAAVAQSAERILGKDEVGSSNLPSSSIKSVEIPMNFDTFFFLHICTKPASSHLTSIWRPEAGFFHLCLF